MADDYDVGYGRPPKHSQFRKGQSGNPKGREKGTRGLKTDLIAELNAKHTINLNKKPVTGTKQRLMLMTLATRAAAGDVKAAQVVLPLILQILGVEDRNVGSQKLSPQDQAILDQLLSDRADEGPGERPAPEADHDDGMPDV